MPHIRLFPHPIATPQSVIFGPWWQELPDGTQLELPDRMAGWDYATELVVGTSVAIDVAELLRSTEVESLAEIEVVLIGECPASRVTFTHRFTGDTAFDTADEAKLTLALPKGQLASLVRLSAHLVTATNRILRGRITPKGSRLASSATHILALEGDGSRFPTEVVSFEELRIPNDIPWTLRLTFEDFESSFMGGVRLLVNADHPAGRRLIDPKTTSTVASLVRAEVFRVLLATAASRRDEIVDIDFDEESVAYVLSSMCENYLLRSLSSAIDLALTDPVRLEQELHRGLNAVNEIVK